MSRQNSADQEPVAPHVPQDATPCADNGQDELAHKLGQAEARAAELEQALRAALAEVEHARRRANDDIAHAHKFALENFAKALLPFKDSLETALRIDTPDAPSFRDGVEVMLKQLHAAFEKNGLITICPAPGDRFDPAQHQLPDAQHELGNGVVRGVVRPGYAINGRVLRPAIVTAAEQGGE